MAAERRGSVIGIAPVSERFESEADLAVKREQAAHGVTLLLMQRLVEALRVRGASGNFATRFCVLCQNSSPNTQKGCLHVLARDHIDRERQRMGTRE